MQGLPQTKVKPAVKALCLCQTNKPSYSSGPLNPLRFKKVGSSSRSRFFIGKMHNIKDKAVIAASYMFVSQSLLNNVKKLNKTIV
jgi:hypothetical protein